MKKKLINIFALVLSLVMIFSVSACNTNNENNNATSDKSVNVGAEPLSFDVKKINGENAVLVEYGRSNYQIIIPENASDLEKYAAEELQSFLEASTACRLPIKTDANINASTEIGGKYISIGDTKLFTEQNAFAIDRSKPRNAPRIFTLDNTVYLIGQSNELGTLYATYKFLYYEIAFQAYAVDCIYYETKSKLLLCDFDYQYEPALDYATGYGEVSTASNADEAARLFLRAKDTSGASGAFGINGEKDFATWCHSVTAFASQSVYGKDYPHWFGNGQLCYSQIEETDDVDLWEKVAENAINRLHIDDTPYIMLGGADNTRSCQCEKCTQGYKLYGISGVMNRFMNKVGEVLEEHYDHCDKHKYEDVILVSLAYEAYSSPPTDIIDGKIVPKDESVVLRHNVGACFTPIHMCITHPIEGENSCDKNSSYLNQLKGWSAVCENLFVYDYGYYSKGCLYYCNEWDSIKYNINAYDKYGVDYVLGQNATNNGLEPFAALRIYLKSKLAWDPLLDQEMLIKDFMKHYYGDASGAMMEFFNAICEHYEWIEAKNGSGCGSVYAAFFTTTEWPRDVLVRFETMLRSAYNLAALTAKATDTQRAYYAENVYKELTMVRFVNYTSYPTYYSEKERLVEINELTEMLEKYKIVSAADGTRIDLKG